MRTPRTKNDAPPRASDELVEALTACIRQAQGTALVQLGLTIERQATNYPMNWRHERRNSKLLVKILDAMVVATGARID